MKIERITNRNILNEIRNWKWMVKFEHQEDAIQLKRKMGIGRGMVYRAEKSRKYQWLVIAEQLFHFEIEE